MRISPKNTQKKRHTVGVEVEARTLVAHQKREEGQPLALRAAEQPQIGNVREAVEGLGRELALAAADGLGAHRALQLQHQAGAHRLDDGGRARLLAHLVALQVAVAVRAHVEHGAAAAAHVRHLQAEVRVSVLGNIFFFLIFKNSGA